MTALMRPEMSERLRRLRIKIETPDSDTLVLHDVPTNHGFFNKPLTNLLLKRPRSGLPFVVCVDSDLVYLGDDSLLARTFASSQERVGWRALFHQASRESSPEPAIERALDALGADGGDPTLRPDTRDTARSGDGSLIETHGQDLSCLAASPKAPVTVGRERERDEIIATLRRWSANCMPVVTGESGVGRSNLLVAVARRLKESEASDRLVRIDLGVLLSGAIFDAERENTLTSLFAELRKQPDTILALEHFDLVVAEVPHGVYMAGRALDDGCRLIAVTLPAFASQVRRAPLQRRMHFVHLSEPDGNETMEILRALRSQIASHHGLEAIDDQVIRLCVRVAADMDGHFPAKAISLLDSSAAQATLSGSQALGPDDILFAARRPG